MEKIDQEKELPESVCVGSCCKVSSRKGPSSRGMKWRREQDHIWGGGSTQGPRWSWLVVGGQQRDQQDCSKRARQSATGDGDREEKGGRLSGTRQRNLGSSRGKVKGPRKQSCSHLLCVRNLCFI